MINIKVEELMTPFPICLNEEDSFEKAIEIFKIEKTYTFTVCTLKQIFCLPLH